jgi:hypothetical protein
MRALIDGGADVNIQFNGWAAIAFATEFANDNEGGTCCLWARSALSIPSIRMADVALLSLFRYGGNPDVAGGRGQPAARGLEWLQRGHAGGHGRAARHAAGCGR